MKQNYLERFNGKSKTLFLLITLIFCVSFFVAAKCEQTVTGTGTGSPGTISGTVTAPYGVSNESLICERDADNNILNGGSGAKRPTRYWNDGNIYLAYTEPDIAPGTWYLTCYLDKNFNQILDAGEYYSSVGYGPFTIAGNTVTGVNVTIDTMK
ncbi:MAG: hypothetical protein OEV44_01590 [Spirochaetota bacterium]|nr:hypothetical protein [Spirochaetota bacterium]